MILIGQLVVQLYETVETMPSQIAGCLIVFRAGRSSKCRGRPEGCERAGSVQQVRSYGVMGNAEVIEIRIGLGLIGGGRLCCLTFGADQKILVLAGEKEEKLVFNDRSTNGEAIVLQSRGGLAGAERILAFKEFVVVGVVSAAVKLIGAGLDGEVGGAAGIAAQRCGTGGDKGEVVNGVDGEDDPGDGRLLPRFPTLALLAGRVGRHGPQGPMTLGPRHILVK